MGVLVFLGLTGRHGQEKSAQQALGSGAVEDGVVAAREWHLRCGVTEHRGVDRVPIAAVAGDHPAVGWVEDCVAAGGILDCGHVVRAEVVGVVQHYYCVAGGRVGEAHILTQGRLGVQHAHEGLNLEPGDHPAGECRAGHRGGGEAVEETAELRRVHKDQACTIEGVAAGGDGRLRDGDAVALSARCTGSTGGAAIVGDLGVENRPRGAPAAGDAN